MEILVTNFDHGGLKKVICSENSEACYSLHSLWDSEILKMSTNAGFEQSIITEYEEDFDLKHVCTRLNQFICTLYDFPDNITVDQYIEKFDSLSIFLVRIASYNIANILNSKIVYPESI